jgi:glycosyltransferase involved in cell wall biosynthesis
MSSPLFSIVIPTCNSASTLENCLDSIIRQSEKSVQVVIQDAQSTDQTSEIINHFQEQGLAIDIISEADLGIYDAMNRGMARASGEWLFFLGSDDELLDDTVLGAVRSALTNFIGSLAYGSVQILGDSSWAKDGDIYDGAFDLQKLLTKNICHQAIFYRRTFLDSRIGNFEIKYRLCADWDLNLRCWPQTPFLYLDLVIARFNAGGMTTRHAADAAFERDFVKNIETYFEKASDIDKAFVQQHAAKLKKFYRENSPGTFRKYFNRIRKKIGV